LSSFFSPVDIFWTLGVDASAVNPYIPNTANGLADRLNWRRHMLITITYKELCAIHFANGYDSDSKAQAALNNVGNELGGAAWADVMNAPSFGDYTDSVEFLD
jgi:hypothetical protein